MEIADDRKIGSLDSFEKKDRKAPLLLELGDKRRNLEPRIHFPIDRHELFGQLPLDSLDKTAQFYSDGTSPPSIGVAEVFPSLIHHFADDGVVNHPFRAACVERKAMQSGDIFNRL